MSSRCYLATSNLDTIYPSFVEEKYDAAEQTLCTDVDSIPLLWMGLFREENIRRETFEVEGTSVTVEAPVVEREKGLQQLRSSLYFFNKMFARDGQLDDFVAMLIKAVSGVSSKYITLEMQEIALMFDDDQWFYDEFRKALKSIAKKRTSADDKERMYGITQLREGDPFPSARMYLDKKEFSPEDQWNFTRLIGAGRFGSFGWGREVPWETADANFSFSYTPADDDDEALDFEDEDYDDEGEEPESRPPKKG